MGNSRPGRLSRRAIDREVRHWPQCAAVRAAVRVRKCGPPGRERADRRGRDRRRRPRRPVAASAARGRPDRGAVRLQSAAGRGLQGQQEGRLARLPGLSQAARPQGHRRGDRGHRRVPARAALHSRLSRRGKDVYAEKPLDALHPRGPRPGRRRAQARAHLPGRLAAALDGDEPRRLRTGAQRRPGQGAGSARGQLHRAARTRRPSRCPRSRCPPGSTGTSGSTRPPCGRTTRSGWAGCAGGTSPAAR